MVSDIKLFLVALPLMNKLKFPGILLIYDISETEGIQQLARLDRMKIESESLPLDQRFATSPMMAMRPWELMVFEDLRRIEDKRVFGG